MHSPHRTHEYSCDAAASGQGQPRRLPILLHRLAIRRPSQPAPVEAMLRRLSSTTLSLGLAFACLALAATGAVAGTGSSVVPPGGKVSGKGYAYWLARSWQVTLAATSTPVKSCETLAEGSHRVAFLTIGAAASGTYTHTCTEPAGRPIYVQELSGECSSFNGDHNGFGTTPAELKRCSMANLKGATAGTSIDGRSVTHFKRFIFPTSPYTVHLPKKNMFNSARHTGRSVAYGYGLLLTGLRAGTHTIVVHGSIPAAKYEVTATYAVHVR